MFNYNYIYYNKLHHSAYYGHGRFQSISVSLRLTVSCKDKETSQHANTRVFEVFFNNLFCMQNNVYISSFL